VIPDGKNLVSHAGTALLAELADRSGLTNAMSVAMAEIPQGKWTPNGSPR
jgi:hypothetical protein